MNQDMTCKMAIAIGKLCATAPVAEDWHTHSFVPVKLKLLSAPAFPDSFKLSLVGRGELNASQDHPENLWPLRVFGLRNAAEASPVFYLKDPISHCLSRVDLSRPILATTHRSFELKHQLAGDCRDNSLLGLSLVVMFQCGEVRCQEQHNLGVSFSGPIAFEDLTILDYLFFAGDFEIGGGPELWDSAFNIASSATTRRQFAS